jgi:hypothetical protein
MAETLSATRPDAAPQPGLPTRMRIRVIGEVTVLISRWGLATRRLYSGVQFKLQRVAVSISVFIPASSEAFNPDFWADCLNRADLGNRHSRALEGIKPLA